MYCCPRDSRDFGWCDFVYPLIIESPVEELVWERQSRTGYVLRMRKRDENERKC